MKLANPIAGWGVAGEFVTLIPAGNYLTDQEMLEYYGLTKFDPNYKYLVKPSKVARCVLRRGRGCIVVPLSHEVTDVSA